MTRHPDPIVRRCLVYDRARVRVRRRMDALLAFLDAHPDAWRATNPELRRLDDMLGEADALRKTL